MNAIREPEPHPLSWADVEVLERGGALETAAIARRLLEQRERRLRLRRRWGAILRSASFIPLGGAAVVPIIATGSNVIWVACGDAWTGLALYALSALILPPLSSVGEKTPR